MSLSAYDCQARAAALDALVPFVPRADGLAARLRGGSPRVEYELTERGHSRESELWALWKWGARDQPTVAATGVP